MKKIIFVIIFYGINLSELYSQMPGSLDLSFDTDGKVITPIGSGDDYGTGVAIQPDGKILVAGTVAYIDFAMARYNADGSLDNTFDIDGKLTTDFGNPIDVGTSIAIQADGKIIITGFTNSGSNYDFAIARYNNDGSLDISFDSDGKLTLDFAGDDYGYCMVIQTDGKIIAAGSSTNVDDDFGIVRFNANGSLDTSFDIDGKQVTDFGIMDGISALTIQPDGKIIAAGITSGVDFDFAIARYNVDGSLDNTFDGDGKLITSVGSLDDLCYSVTLQPDGKIIAAGYLDNGTDFVFAMVRYNSDGSLDNTFDGDGKLTTDFAGVTIDESYAALLQSDGKIILAGTSSSNFALACYNSNGSLDTTFDSDGMLTTDFEGLEDDGTDAILQEDGKIVVAGYTWNGTNYDFAVARYISGLNLGVVNFSLDNNSVLIYPNPIAQDTKLEYILNNKEIISISLMDVQGKMIKTFLNNEKQEQGSYTQVLNFPVDLAPGNYYVIISTPSAKVSIKIIK